MWYTYGQHTRARSQGQRNILDWVMYEAVRQCLAHALDRPISALLSREMLQAERWRAEEDEIARWAYDYDDDYDYDVYDMHGNYVEWDP